ncbi:hypothetical protein BaRGS_00031744 [Batillaria attramentaria]|uniref:Uncharacterized protein n=1 Tax=Batillaria attramentaria TaxID=370345 RepID=A0ABD0JPX7_9CAEN
MPPLRFIARLLPFKRGPSKYSSRDVEKPHWASCLATQLTERLVRINANYNSRSARMSTTSKWWAHVGESRKGIVVPIWRGNLFQAMTHCKLVRGAPLGRLWH